MIDSQTRFVPFNTRNIFRLINLFLCLLLTSQWPIKWSILPKYFMKTVKIERKSVCEFERESSRASSIDHSQHIVIVVDQEVMITEIGMENRKRNGVTDGDVIRQPLYSC